MHLAVLKVHLYLAKAKARANFFFDLCRCLMWTLNYILHEPIWKRCHFHCNICDSLRFIYTELKWMWTLTLSSACRPPLCTQGSGSPSLFAPLSGFPIPEIHVTLLSVQQYTGCYWKVVARQSFSLFSPWFFVPIIALLDVNYTMEMQNNQSIYRYQSSYKDQRKQESIPIGCVPPTC